VNEVEGHAGELFGLKVVGKIYQVIVPLGAAPATNLRLSFHLPRRRESPPPEIMCLVSWTTVQ